MLRARDGDTVIGGWRDIESAPKDKSILIYAFGFYVAHWSRHYGMWIGFAHDTSDTMLINHLKPTHWMPIPAPPK